MAFIRLTTVLTTFAVIAAITGCGSDNSVQSDGAMLQGGPDGGVAPEFKENRTICEALHQGPLNNNEYGPLGYADLDGDGRVLRQELETFLDQATYRRTTIVEFFALFDEDEDGALSPQEFAEVSPSYGFDGTDLNGDCMITRDEILTYANQEGRRYRTIGLGAFYELVDENADSILTSDEIETARDNGLLARF